MIPVKDTGESVIASLSAYGKARSTVKAALCTGGDRLSRAEGDNLLGPLRNLR